MRIVAGKYKGRRLKTPEGMDIRPTTDRMRERIFSMLQHPRYPNLIDAKVADLYAGTGALGLEALSRGAAHITFVEKSPRTLNENIKTLANDNSTLIRGNATRLPKATHACDVIFLDPPYRRDLVTPTLVSILEQGWLAETGVIIAELAIDDNAAYPEGLIEIDSRQQGQQKIVFIQRAT